MKPVSVLKDLNACQQITASVNLPLNSGPESVIRYRSEIACKLIGEDISRGVLPVGISCFAQLHDSVDANMYLLDETESESRLASFYNWPELGVSGVINCFNRVIDNVDAWLVSQQGAVQ